MDGASDINIYELRGPSKEGYFVCRCGETGPGHPNACPRCGAYPAHRFRKLVPWYVKKRAVTRCRVCGEEFVGVRWMCPNGCVLPDDGRTTYYMRRRGVVEVRWEWVDIRPSRAAREEYNLGEQVVIPIFDMVLEEEEPSGYELKINYGGVHGLKGDIIRVYRGGEHVADILLTKGIIYVFRDDDKLNLSDAKHLYMNFVDGEAEP